MDKEINLDPKKARGISFISHAHTDHCPRGAVSGQVILTKETKRLMRNCRVTDCYSTGREIELDNLVFRICESGHILGSGQLYIENDFKFVYTGDLNVRGGATTGRAEILKCDILIIETTFGSPFYSFPERKEVIKDIKDWIDGCHKKDKTPVLLGYSLGKAQELTKELSSDFSISVHETIYEMNRRYEELGVELGDYSHLDDDTNSRGRDAVLIVPPHLKKTLPDNCCTAFASGWAVKEGMNWCNAETSFPLSDHSDFTSLIEYVEKASPQMVYTIHGFAEEFSEELRVRGFYSEPLLKGQRKSGGH